jgi:hypothetical protein
LSEDQIGAGADGLATGDAKVTVGEGTSAKLLTDGTSAFVAENATVTAKQDIEVVSNDKLSSLMVAGTVAVGGTAGVGAGIWKDLKEAATIIKAETETLPNPENQPAYEKTFQIYEMLYHALKPVYDKSAELGY